MGTIVLIFKIVKELVNVLIILTGCSRHASSQQITNHQVKSTFDMFVVWRLLH
jgi:hypothetical protein